VTPKENRLIVGDDHLRQSISHELVEALLGDIKAWPLHLGWLDLDLQHRHTWPCDQYTRN
jgi:hypothetical protein